jgi:hypothetical protein
MSGKKRGIGYQDVLNDLKYSDGGFLTSVGIIFKLFGKH